MTLYIVSTPVGNLEDITLRALRILKEVDLVLCEDTRVTRKLLDNYNIDTPMMSYHQYSKGVKVKKVISLLGQDKDLALVTDAGTPGISDPGNELISVLLKSSESRIKNHESRGGAIHELPLRIVPIPGPSALTAALSIAGVPSDGFLFLGFLPHKKGKQKIIQEIAESKRTVVFYESKYRIVKTLEKIYEIFRQSSDAAHDGIVDSGNLSRRFAVCRELTKMHETVYRGSIEEVMEHVKRDAVRGEYVVIVGSK